ncbi:putative Calcium binding protein/cast [Melia azedarach]|uniref:Calcium binding protein/cast n=2 Tax=Melia azedarach TaxID=155640 RepID=A0ACC1X8J1_MELAZ|nr:putative Calcium binding protein/cast [Melia azedarach]KAJ4707658.1 putative Calcium binding protein/cast [Melia azedarach]
MKETEQLHLHARLMFPSRKVVVFQDNFIKQQLQLASRGQHNFTLLPFHNCDCEQQQQQQQEAVPQEVDDLMLRALTSVFGMENNGKINKERARKVVEKLGLMYGEDGKSSFDLPGGGILEDEVPVEEALGKLEEGSKRNELLREAFKIFDEDGNGYIDAAELKRVLECLGLDKGWDMVEIEKMLKVVDLNLDGRVDFGEFELMMMMG